MLRPKRSSRCGWADALVRSGCTGVGEGSRNSVPFIKLSLNTTASLLAFFFQGLENVAFPPPPLPPSPPKPGSGPSGRPFDRKLMILNVLLMHNE